MTQSVSDSTKRADLDRARRLQALALALFDGAAPVHRLPEETRHLLQLAAMFYDAGRSAEPERPHRAGRDLALDRPLDGYSMTKQAIVASVVALQREKPRPQREPAFLRLDSKDQQTALRLAAILQIAEGIGDIPSAALLSVDVDDDQTTLALGGPITSEQVVATLHDTLWREAFGKLSIRTDQTYRPGGDAALAGEPAQENGWGAAVELLLPLAENGHRSLLDGGEPIAEGARRVLRRFFDKLLAREDAVRKDEDDEDVHQMRVATRRLRASLQVAEPIYEHELIRRYRRGLRGIAESLGAVRDCDVFLKHVSAYYETCPEEDRAGVQRLLDAIGDQREHARERLLADLERRNYRKLKRAFAEFLTTPGAGLAAAQIGPAMRVRDFAGSAIWRRYEQWRVYEVALTHISDETLHQARIAGKRLRYTLEFFAEALGSNVDQVLTPLVTLQDNLGELQDSVVARTRIHALGLDEDAAIQAYLEAREAERAAHLAEFPRLWEKVASATYRRRLFELIVKV